MTFKVLKNKTIKSKIIIYNFITICVVAVLVSICSYVTANQRTLKIAENSLQNNVENISYRYQIAYEEMINIVLNCTERKALDLSKIGNYTTFGSKSSAIKYMELLSDFCAVTGYGNYISRISVFNENDVLIQTGTIYGSQDDRERIINTYWFEEELKKTMDYYQLDLVKSPFWGDKGNILPIVKSLDNTESKDKGWVVLCISTKLFQDVLDECTAENESIVVTAAGERIAFINEKEENIEENNEIIKSILEKEETSGMFSKRVHGEKSIISYKKLPQSGIMTYEVLTLDTLKNDKIMLVQTIAIIFIACSIIGLILSFVFTSQVKKPIDNLVHHIEKISEGDFSQSKSIESEDEIGYVGKVVNTMSGEIDNLMKQRVEAEKEKSDLELKMLQAQINPHFLYNTLDSIKWIAVIQKNTGIVKVVTALSSLLKNMAKGFNEKVTLKKELEFLSDYVTIEKVKYVELFDVKIDVQKESLYEVKVIKLTLQPIVENAIFCGIEPSGKNGLIEINAFEKDEALYITIRDNGAGIPKDKIKDLLKETEKVKGDRMSGIGLANVDRRIKLTYGEEYGIEIESELGSFTQITVKTPLEY